MKRYETGDGLLRALRGMFQEWRRLREEAVALKTQYEEILRRFRAGVLAGDKARDLAYAVRDRIELIRNELTPLVETRAKALLVEYIDLVRSGSVLAEPPKKPWVKAARPPAGDELRN